MQNTAFSSSTYETEYSVKKVPRSSAEANCTHMATVKEGAMPSRKGVAKEALEALLSSLM